MKRIYFGFVLLLMAACTKQDVANKENSEQLSASKKSTISLDEAIRMYSQNKSKTALLKNTSSMTLAATAAIATKTIDLSTIDVDDGCVFENNGTILASGVELIGMHGYVYYSSEATESLSLSAEKISGTTHGSGFAIKFPFKRGKSYKIRTQISTHSTVAPLDIDFQLSNQLSFGSLCDRNAAEVTLPNSSPIVTKNGTANKVVDISVDFVPNDCFEYLIINGRYKGSIDNNHESSSILDKIYIDETPMLSLEGPDIIAMDSTAEFSAKIGGFTVAEDFNWSVSGDLEIVGSNIGSSAVIKSTGFGGGDIKISLDGCDDLLEKKLGMIASPSNVEIVGPRLLNVPIYAGITYSLKLSGPLLNYKILDAHWTFPPSWEQHDMHGTPISILLADKARQGEIKVDLSFEGTSSTVTVKTVVKVTHDPLANRH